MTRSSCRALRAMVVMSWSLGLGGCALGRTARGVPTAAMPFPGLDAQDAPAMGATPAVRVTQAGPSTRLALMPADALADATATLAPTSLWDLDVLSFQRDDRVAHYVEMFSGRSRDRIADRLSRGTRYEPMIRAAFREGGLPEDMYYLALVESGYDPHAYSRAAAVGMWQFMATTGRDMGLRIDEWVDERRDPVRSTDAAVRFIRGLNRQFGSVYLAAAAYNGGPGRISRGLTMYADELPEANRDSAFFVLAGKDYLRDETREYVPQLIAAALVAKDVGRYGLQIARQEPFAYDSVTVPGATPLDAIATACGAKLAAILDLNPQYLRGMTPPRVRSGVRIPVGAAADFERSFGLLPAGARQAYRVVESRKGDTVDGIAEANGVASASIERFNAPFLRLKSGRLAPGQEVLVPAPAVARAALRIPGAGAPPQGEGRTSTTARTKRPGSPSGRTGNKSGTRKPGARVSSQRR